MSFFAKGDFKIQQSWEVNRKKNSASKQRQKNLLFMNAAKNIVQPSTDILDDDLSKKILKEFQSQRTPAIAGKSEKNIQSREANRTPNKPPVQVKAPNNQSEDLLTSLASRLKKVQQTVNNQRMQMKEKNDQIQKLKTENAFLKGMKNDSGQAYKQMQALKNNNEQLKKKVLQMEGYLKQYGLKWVGNKMDGNLQHQKMKKDIKAANKFKYKLPSEIDINTIRRRIEQLNAGLHSEGQGTEIYIENGIHKFRKAQPLTIGFFADGIAIKGFKFAPYNTKQAMRILSDLLDGYFPYIFKNKYPDGVFLKVMDKVEKKYEEFYSEEGVNNLRTAQEKQLKPPSKQEFLNKLPKQVIKNGKVIEIRSEFEKRLNGQKQQIQTVKSDHFEEIQGQIVFKTQEHFKLVNEQICAQDVCSLKIRTENQVCILELRKEHRIKDVYDWMSKLLSKKFKLMGNYPRRSYEEEQTENLESLGFYPNGILHIQLA